jgi:5-methylcytosine-specific restriction enzyme subunit McrC
VARTVYQCREFEPVEVPLDRLISGGQVQVYPSAEKYFDLDYRAGRLVIAPKSYVGLIPINDDVAIQVLPRFPISNLFHVLHRSSATLRFIEGFTRSYELQKPDSLSDPIAMLANQLVALGVETLRSGLLRRYLRVTDDLNLGGSLDLSSTVTRFRVQGIRGRSAWVRTEHSYQLRENQLVKLALQRVVGYLARGGSRIDLERLRAAKELLFAFDRVAAPSTGLHFDETELAQMVARLPSLHRQYAALLWLSYLLHARRGISEGSLRHLRRQSCGRF